MKQSINQTTKFLFALSISVFFVLGFLIVGGQAVGLVIQNSALISRSYELFAVPSISMAVIAGLMGYINYNTIEKPAFKDLEDEED
ncbi:hypothetical protein N24_1076 [Corynebacterium suranareeae]|uniref:Uncharacterized protein n=1 Tax=Corynebacterium suranareeae TaxID=2506452 RepID=A0A161JM45_9CORY|nr:hypothetical protein [Corynebacterium suranareeae]BAU95338.1 hypothetical protein N24_1076 [Corynebacterium suranareeae]